MTTYPLATDDQFTPSRFHTAKDKRLTVNATVRFLKTGLDPAKLTLRAYYFFHQTLSMSAEYDLHGFACTHFADDDTKSRFLYEVRRHIACYAALDTERDSDMAALFLTDRHGDDHGVYADLLDGTRDAVEVVTGRTPKWRS